MARKDVKIPSYKRGNGIVVREHKQSRPIAGPPTMSYQDPTGKHITMDLYEFYEAQAHNLVKIKKY